MNKKLHQLINKLKEFQTIYTLLGEPYKSAAYRKAIASLISNPFILVNLNDNTYKTPGIGDGIRSKITEFTTTNTIKELDTLKSNPRIKAFTVFSKILGVGPITSSLWYSMGINNIAQLKQAINTEQIKLTTVQRLGLKYYTDLNSLIPAAEVKRLSQYIFHLLRGISINKFVITGSYRRGKPFSGDIDILISTSASIQNIKQVISLSPNYIASIATGLHKITFLYKSPITNSVRQIDIIKTTTKEYPYALNYFTGSAIHNEYLRSVAKSKGLLLNQYSLFNKTTNYSYGHIKNEKDIYTVLGIKYIPPSRRFHAGADYI